MEASITSIAYIEPKIYVLRGKNVMIDEDLAQLYGVKTKVLIQAVKRKIARFPEDFMFQLNQDEHDFLRSQTVTSKTGRGGRRYTPYAFTQEGIAMLSSVLNSERAIQVNIQIMRAFIKLKNILSRHPTHEEFANFKQELLKKLEVTEKKYDEQFQMVFQAIKQLLRPMEKPRRKIGF